MPSHRPDPDAVDAEALSVWLDREEVGSGPLSELVPLSGGTQNRVLRFERGGRSLVLRLPASVAGREGDHAILREATILRALRGSEVPHAALVSTCSDASVLGRAFYVMEAIDGTNPTESLPPPHRAEAAWRHQLGLSMVDAALAIAAVPITEPLRSIGRPEGFLERQVQRWQRQLESYESLPGYAGEQLPQAEELGSWLDRNRPARSEVGLLHGDFHLANVMVTAQQPGVAAVIDWELATVGDPMLDLGWLLATWPAEDGTRIGTVDVQPWDGFPSRDELIGRYLDATGRAESLTKWFEVLACYKLAIILEGTHARACAGQADPRTGELLHGSAMELMRRGLSCIGQ